MRHHDVQLTGSVGLLDLNLVTRGVVENDSDSSPAGLACSSEAHTKTLTTTVDAEFVRRYVRRKHKT